MSEEELIEKLSNYLKDSLGKDLIKALKTTLDKLQKDNYKLDRENQHFFDRIQDLQKENEELSESNFHFLEINQKLIEEKPMIKELTEKELNLLEKIDKLQKDSISKDIIRDKIKEYNEQREKAETKEINDMFVNYIDDLEELLGE